MSKLFTNLVTLAAKGVKVDFSIRNSTLVVTYNDEQQVYPLTRRVTLALTNLRNRIEGMGIPSNITFDGKSYWDIDSWKTRKNDDVYIGKFDIDGVRVTCYVDKFSDVIPVTVLPTTPLSDTVMANSRFLTDSPVDDEIALTDEVVDAIGAVVAENMRSDGFVGRFDDLPVGTQVRDAGDFFVVKDTHHREYRVVLKTEKSVAQLARLQGVSRLADSPFTSYPAESRFPDKVLYVPSLEVQDMTPVSRMLHVIFGLRVMVAFCEPVAGVEGEVWTKEMVEESYRALSAGGSREERANSLPRWVESSDGDHVELDSLSEGAVVLVGASSRECFAWSVSHSVPAFRLYEDVFVEDQELLAERFGVKVIDLNQELDSLFAF